MLGMKNHFDISGSIEIREVDIAGVACTKNSKTRGPWATTLTWTYSYEGYIQPKYCKCCMQEK